MRGWIDASGMRSSRRAPLNAASWSEASQIEKPRGSPASVLYWRRSRRQNAWNVPIVSASAFRLFFGARCPRPDPAARSPATRSRISAAALFVKVIARMFFAATRFESRCAMRTVTTRVLPVPAPASTSTGPRIVVTARRCSGLSAAIVCSRELT